MSALPDPAAWQAMLDRHGNAFGNLRSGSRIGIGRRSDLLHDDASIVVWEARRGRLYAESKPFCGYDDKSLDIMQVRQGGFVCFLMRAQCDLVEAGYEDVLQSMGIIFMGACR
jgi:hypothetical protein